MESRKSLFILRILAAFLLVSLSAVAAVALDEDTDPNSPTPILLSYSTTTRALAVDQETSKRIDLSRIPIRAFAPNSTIVLFAANLSLMKGEGAGAFRVYAQDGSGHYFRFPVLSIAHTPGGSRDMYSVTVQLTDEIRYWPAPSDGDLMLMLTWRGLASNRVRLGLGQIGGGMADDEGAKPTPPGTTVAKSATTTAAGDEPDYVGYRWSGDRMRFQEQASFGPSQALDSRIRRIGLKIWLNEQFNTQYPSDAGNCSTYPVVSDPLAYPCQPLKQNNNNLAQDCDNDQTVVPDVPVTCYRDTYSQYQPQTWFFRQAYYGDAQLRHRVAWALGEIWVTSGVDIEQGRHMVEYHRILSNNAFGNYRTLMKQMTLDPTMGEYLSMVLSTKNSPNENYAREIMQLFTVGLFMLDQQGRVQCTEHPGHAELCLPTDTEIPTYDQNGVNNLTKVFTGWSRCQNQTNPACTHFVNANTQNYIDPMVLANRNNHDLTAKTLLSWPADPAFPPNHTTINPCTGCTGTAIDAYAAQSMDDALDNMFYHPNVAPFVCRTLIQHLVTSDPTPAYVGRVAAVFNDNGLGVRGDLKAVVKAILLDPEARGDVKTDPFYGKLREPVQYTTNLFRTFNVRSADGAGQTDGYIAFAGQNFNGRGEFNGMAQIPFFSPTVFNYFPPGYVVPGTTMNGPEFAILTTGTAIQRASFINRYVYTAIPIPVSADAPNGLSLDFSDLQALEAADTTNSQMIDELNRRMLHSTMSAQMKSTISTACNAVTLSGTPTSEQLLNRVRMAIYLVATSSQYQVQR